MNKKSYSFDMETFKNMLLICPKLPGQKFVDPPFVEEILTFIRELGYPGNIKLLYDVKVNTLPQPWRTFRTIINKCLSGKVTGIDTLRLSRAQILWGLYHQEKVDYVYLLWEDLHEVGQRYHAILPDYLTNPAMKESEAYETYYDLATGKVQPKPKYVRRSSRTKTNEAPKPSFGKRVKATAKVANGSGAHKGTSVTPGVPDVPEYESDDEQISWKSSEEEDDDEVNVSDRDDDERTESDNDGEDFVHPKFSTHDDEARQEEVNEEDSFDPRVQTPSHVESTDDEDDNEEVQGVNIEGKAMDKAANNKEDEGNELYRDLNVNLEGRDVEMTDDQPTNVQITEVREDTHVIITPVIPEGQPQSSSVSSGFISNMLNPIPDTGINSIFNTEATSLVDVPVTTITEPPLVFATTLPLPPTPLITHMQQIPFPIPTTTPSTSLQDLPNFSSLFGFDHRLKTLETNFFEFKQMNQFDVAVSSIPGIVDAYLENEMNNAVKTAVQLQSDRLRDEAQAKNEEFLNKLDDIIKK
ncbi:hypothetical protein Tco_0011136 [Tanacetum coccineum]